MTKLNLRLRYDPVPRLWTRLQQSDNGVSHFHLVSGSLDMKNHRGACLSGGHEIRYRPNPIWPPSAIMKFQLFYFFGVDASVIPLI